MKKMALFFILMMNPVLIRAENVDLTSLILTPKVKNHVQYSMITATEVHGKILAYLKQMGLTRSWKAATEYQYGTIHKYILAWLKKDCLEIIFKGPKFHYFDYFLRFAVFNKSANRLPSVTYPFLLIRDDLAESCPYILGFPHFFICFNEDLKVEAKVATPFLARGYSILAGQLWIMGLYKGYLAHRFDLKQHQFTEHTIPFTLIRNVLAKNKYPQEILNQYQPVDAKNSEPDKAKKIRNFYRNWLKKTRTRPEAVEALSSFYSSLTRLSKSSFPFAIAITSHRVGILLKKPLGLIVCSWPQCQNPQFWSLINPTTSPSIHKHQFLEIIRLIPIGEKFLATFIGSTPVTWQTVQKSNPSLANKIREEKFKGRLPSPNAVVLYDLDILFGLFESPERIHFYVAPRNGELDLDFKYPAPFMFRPNQIWLNVISMKNHDLIGLARLELP